MPDASNNARLLRFLQWLCCIGVLQTVAGLRASASAAQLCEITDDHNITSGLGFPELAFQNKFSYS
jgi:hypothetical protein